MMNCPLPIDWIEYLEGAVSDEFTTHLPKCRPCQLLVEELRREKRPRLSRAPFVESWPRWTETRDAAPAFGDIWWTSSESPEAQISIGFRIVVLVVSDVWQEHGRLWCEVVPLSTNVEDATSLDVVLLRRDTDTEVPWTVLLRNQMIAEVRDLDTRFGRLTDPGQALIRDVVAGHAPHDRFGSPIDGPDDPRASIPQELHRAVRLLGQKYARLLDDQTSTRSARILAFPMQRTSFGSGKAAAQLSLAASTAVEQTARQWAIELPERGRLRGRIEHRYMEDVLLFVVEEVIEEQLGLGPIAWIAAWSDRLKAPVTSQPFHPTVDREIVISKDMEIFPQEVSRLELRLSDEA